MESQLKVANYPIQYEKYPETVKSSASETATVAKTAAENKKSADVDVFEPGKAEDPAVKEMEEQLERIRKFRFNENNKGKRKVKHNIGEIRGRILSSSSSMVVRMALSSAYGEMASISVCTSAQGYDNQSTAKAMAQIKKVIAAGRMKVANLTKEEQEALAVNRAKKRLQNQEIQELRRELIEDRVRHRRDERRQIGRPYGDGKGNDANQLFSDRYDVDLPTASTPAVSAVIEGVSTASVPTASVPTASVPTASVPTASVPTASVLSLGDMTGM